MNDVVDRALRRRRALAAACARAVRRQQTPSARRRRSRPPRSTPARHRATCSRATAPPRARRSSGRSSRTRRTAETQMAAGLALRPARRDRKAPTSTSSRRCGSADGNPDVLNNHAVYLCRNGRATKRGEQYFAARPRRARCTARRRSRSPTPAGVRARTAATRRGASSTSARRSRSARIQPKRCCSSRTCTTRAGNEPAGARVRRTLPRRRSGRNRRRAGSAARIERALGNDRMGADEILARAAPGISGVRAGRALLERSAARNDSLDATAAPAARDAPGGRSASARARRERGLSSSRPPKNCTSTPKVIRRSKPNDSPRSARRCSCAVTCAVTRRCSACPKARCSAAYERAQQPEHRRSSRAPDLERLPERACAALAAGCLAGSRCCWSSAV